MIISFSVMPRPLRIMKAMRNEVGMAMPTRRPERRPSAATTMIITSTMARKIESDSRDPAYVLTVYGVGYKLKNP